MSTASAALSFATTVESYGGRKSASIRDAHVVSCPRSQSTSFTATGRPPSRPTGCFFARLRVDRCRLAECPLLVDTQKRPDSIVGRGDPLDAGRGQLDRRDFAGFQAAAGVRWRCAEEST